jgi:hypothetical protein
MAKEWANKDKYHASNGVLAPRVQMPRAKASARTVPAWGERKAVGGAAGRVTPVRQVRCTGQTVAGLDRQQLGFHARKGARFGSGGSGSGGWAGEFVGGQFARRSPPRAQYGDGRIRVFEIERRDSPRFSFRGFGPPSGREGWFPHSGYRGGVHGGSFGRKDGLDCANPTFEQMARHWFYIFGTNPSAESFVRSRTRFLFQLGDLKNIWLIDSGCSRHMTGDEGGSHVSSGGEKEVHHFWGQWAWVCAFRR